jgi:hypothetical protein
VGKNLGGKGTGDAVFFIILSILAVGVLQLKLELDNFPAITEIA